MVDKVALITGVTGQDGAYLADLLLRRGYAVCGTSRDAETTDFNRLTALGVREKVKLLSSDPSDFRSVAHALVTAAPDEIYNLSGQASVGLSALESLPEASPADPTVTPSGAPPKTLETCS